MKIFEIMQADRDQYNSKLQHRLVDSTPMGQMYQDLQTTGKINKEHARSADNFLGLQSKAGKRGLCSLTRFRTANMMGIPIDKRTGKKMSSGARNGITPDEYHSSGIHIEHSIPLNMKLKIVEAKYAKGLIPDYATFTKLYEVLSVGVAMTRNEEHAVPAQYRSSHPDIAGDLGNLNVASIKPFARYPTDIIIYDMETGEQVNHQVPLSSLYPQIPQV